MLFYRYLSSPCQTADASQRFLHLIVLGAERNSHIAFAIAAKYEAWGNEDPGLVQHPFGELLGIGILVRDFSPKKHTHLTVVISAAQSLHDALGYFAATAIHVDIIFSVPLFGIGCQGLRRSKLQSAEGTAVYIALDFQYPTDELWV